MPHSSVPAIPAAVSAKSAAFEALGSLDTQAFLARLLSQQTPFGELAVVSSFGAESAVLLHLVATLNSQTRVVFLETGFHFPETLAYRDELIDRFGLEGARSWVLIHCQKSVTTRRVRCTKWIPIAVAR